MLIHYFHRNFSCGFSIEKVSKTYIKEISKTKNVLNFELPKSRASLLAILQNIFYIWRNRNRSGINHIVGDTHYGVIGLLFNTNVVTIHDTVLLDYNSAGRIKLFFFWLLWYYLPCKIATRIVCISEFTKASLLKHVNLQSEDISVIYNPIGGDFTFSEKEFNTDLPVILHIGTKANKNLINVINALAGIKCHLRIIGQLKEDQKLVLKKNKINYSNAFNLTDTQIVEEYKQCDIVSFPSFFEGFGMPIIEAQSIGRVVLTSHIPPMTEVGGNTVYYVNPNNVEDIKKGFNILISKSTLREDLIKKGLENVKRFSVNTIANQYIKLYKDIYKI